MLAHARAAPANRPTQLGRRSAQSDSQRPRRRAAEFAQIRELRRPPETRQAAPGHAGTLHRYRTTCGTPSRAPCSRREARPATDLRTTAFTIGPRAPVPSPKRRWRPCKQAVPACPIAHIQACAAWARHDCFGSRGCFGLAMPLPRPQLSRRGGRTAGSARRCTSRAAGGWRRPPRYRFYAASADHFGPERSSRVDRPRDRNARNAIVSSRDPDQSFRSGTSRPRSCALATDRNFADDAVLATRG